MKVTIEGRLPALNDYISAMNKNRYAGNKMKQDETERVRLHCLRVKKFKTPVYIDFVWYEPNARRDPDNFTSMGRKFILDGLVKAGVIPDDSQKWVLGWSDDWAVDKKNPRVEVNIYEYSQIK